MSASPVCSAVNQAQPTSFVGISQTHHFSEGLKKKWAMLTLPGFLNQ
jgi:hypothetical protein